MPINDARHASGGAGSRGARHLEAPRRLRLHKSRTSVVQSECRRGSVHDQVWQGCPGPLFNAISQNAELEPAHKRWKDGR